MALPIPEALLLIRSRFFWRPAVEKKFLPGYWNYLYIFRGILENTRSLSPWLRRSMPCSRLFWTAIFPTAQLCLRILLWCARIAKNTAKHLHSPATWSQTGLCPTISGRKRDSLCCFTADTICIRKPFWTHRVPPLIQGFGSILCLCQTACILTMCRTGIFTCRNVWQLISAKRLTLSVLPPTFRWFPMNHTGKSSAATCRWIPCRLFCMHRCFQGPILQTLSRHSGISWQPSTYLTVNFPIIRFCICIWIMKGKLIFLNLDI